MTSLNRVTRRRGEELEATILAAAWDELSEVGYTKLTMEGVAARAKTGKQVLYRRWPNRAALVIAAVRHRTGSIVDHVPDTGDLRQDVLAVLRHTASRQHDFPPDVIHGLLAEVPDQNPEFMATAHEVMSIVLRHAAERGEVRMERLTPRMITLPTDLVRHDLLATRNPVDERALLEIVDSIFLPLVRATTAH
ncbi:TetR/AcrR family transcriptional regulator [Nocardia sp. BMG111209]|uniref:TetR/AcrR family transcriptional regulator n=1 Tax=Nocardia sp. BMG111209 TaxID=1160137 RepID=UPI000381866F|nr:TetR/AcrR family transcriptional regulator [Nocardia sp. BMG111209]